MIDTLIAHYRIVRKLGQGGMGEVYLAQDTRLQRQAALKLLPEELGRDGRRRQRFLAEARAASALNHPNVCVIYEVGENEDHRPYLAMEYIEGLTLAALLKEAPLEIREIVELALQIADALDAAYARGIVHRDLKPSNICVTERGQAKVLDFGLAKRLTAASPEPGGTPDAATLDQTAPGQILGTPYYMSPEQAVGRPVDHRTDTFSFGVVLYELTTRQLPFRGDTFIDVMHRVVHATPEPMSRFNAGIPPAFEKVVMRCLEKDPGRRYQVPQELIADLKAILRSLDAAVASSGVPDGAVGLPALASAAVAPDTIASLEIVKDSEIFINCALLDDQPLSADQRGWVSQLQRHLEVRLQQLWGEPIKIGRYPMPPGASPVDPAFFEELARVKTMVSIVSPPFLKAEGCRREVTAFCDHLEKQGGLWRGDKARLLKVVKTPVEAGDIPEPLGGIFARLTDFNFFDLDASTGRVREFDETFGALAKQRFFERIYDLAHELCLVLKACRLGPQAPGAAPFSGRTVFLAETSADLRAERDSLRRELVELGHRVVPDSGLPFDRDALEASVREYLGQSHLSIHLVGNRYGLIPEGAEESMIELQNRWAGAQSRSRDFRRLIWIAPSAAPREERQERFIHSLRVDAEYQVGAEVIEGQLSSLKQLALTRLRPPEPARLAATSSATEATTDHPPQVYLLCDQCDEPAAVELQDWLFEQGLEVSLPDHGAGEEEAGKFHRATMCACDAVLVYFGDVRRSWVETKLRDLLKAPGFGRTTPFASKAVYSTPGGDLQKQRFRTHLADVINAQSRLDTDALRPLVERLKAARGTSA